MQVCSEAFAPERSAKMLTAAEGANLSGAAATMVQTASVAMMEGIARHHAQTELQLQLLLSYLATLAASENDPGYAAADGKHFTRRSCLFQVVFTWLCPYI